MRFLKTGIAVLMMVFSASAIAATNPNEREIVERYSKKITKKHVRKLAWFSASFSLNRINRDNDYNRFSSYTTTHFSNTNLSWLNMAKAASLEFGMKLNNRIAWNVSGEYWLEFGETNAPDSYTPPGGLQTSVSNPDSKIQVYGINAGMDYYVKGAPSVEDGLTGLALKVGASVGYYFVSWDLWDNYQNLNLTTSSPASGNTTFKGTAPALSFGFGAEQPLNLAGLSAALEIEYLYLNFNNVAWYNTIDQEIVATYNSTAGSRVDLGLSGYRGRFELRRYFSW